MGRMGLTYVANFIELGSAKASFPRLSPVSSLKGEFVRQSLLDLSAHFQSRRFPKEATTLIRYTILQMRALQCTLGSRRMCDQENLQCRHKR